MRSHVKCLTVILILLSTITYSNDLRHKLQGTWVCTKIVDADGYYSSGKFGQATDYLKFTFSGGVLWVAHAPFDRGDKLFVGYHRDYFKLYYLGYYRDSERSYRVRSVTENELILTTKNKDGEMIDYHFLNQANLSKEYRPETEPVEQGLIVIKHYKFSYDTKRVSRISDYYFNNEPKNLYPTPIFKDSNYEDFGYYFTSKFKFPKDYPLERVSEEMIVDVEVADHGINSIKIVRGLTFQINTMVVEIIRKTRKKWHPISVTEKPKPITMRLHFVFYLAYAGF